MSYNKEQSESVTWISSQSLVRLRHNANKIPLFSKRIHAKQGGAYLSSLKGRGMEFDESRIYCPGDDIRNIDWRVTARTGITHTKVYQEERERPVFLWLDLNSSMFFATQNAYKSVIATQAAALLAWCVVSHNDRVGGFIFAGDDHIEIKPRRGKSAALNFIGKTVNHPAWNNSRKGSRENNQEKNPKTNQKTSRNMKMAMSRLRKVSHPGSLIFLLSDFREMNKKATSHLANIARQNDVVMINISDPIESELPKSGIYHLSDGNSRVSINTSDKKVREKYAQRYLDHIDFLKTLCRKNRIHLLNISTNQDVLECLKSGLTDQSSTTVNISTSNG